jgi:hypothetical protein
MKKVDYVDVIIHQNGFRRFVDFRASEGTFSHWYRLHLQSIAPTNLHWARVVDYGPISLCVIYKEGQCPSSGGINRLMMISSTGASLLLFGV